MQKTLRFTYWLSIGVLAYIPFHAFISTLFISLLGTKLPVKGLKELVVIATLIPLLVVVAKKRRSIKILYPWLWGFVIAYLLLGILVALVGSGTLLVKVAGLVALYRFIGFFMICYMTAMLLNAAFHPDKRALRIVVLCSIGVVAFGFLQVFVLPKDFLVHFGYGPTTIVPYQTIDNNESLVRILSTLRGPNPLGAYLAMMAPLTWYYARKVGKWRTAAMIAYGVVFAVTLYGSQSRGGWVGFIAGVLTYSILFIKNRKIGLALAGGLLLIMLIGFQLRHTYFIQTTLHHRDPNESSQINSDDQRIDSLKRAVSRVHSQPLGHGVGSSGPPSNYGKAPFIIENTYLDTAYQIGWLGLALFIGINVIVGTMLYRLKTPFGYALLAGLVVVSIIGFFWPVWTDETVALTWWGLAGIVLGTKRKSIKG